MLKIGVMRHASLPAALLLACLSFACNMGDQPKPDPTRAAAPVKAEQPKAVEAKPSTTRKFGGPITAGAVALTEIAKNPAGFAGKDVATSGTVIAVCQSQGCWMELQDDSGQAHVKMAGHAFGVPRDAKGHKARVQGKLIKGDPEEECKQEAAQQLGKPVAKLELEATGVEID